MIIYIFGVIILILCISASLSLLKYFPSSLQLNGKHVMITGASSGIGLELSKLCATYGANVTMVARNKDRLQAAKDVVAGYCQHDEKIVSISCDVSNDYKQIEHMVEEAVRANGSIDVLICNAGVCYPIECAHAKISDIQDSINVNLMGPCLLCKASIDRLSKPGRIVFVSSQAGQIGLYGYSSYSPAKFGLLGLAQSLQMELLEREVYVTVAFPPDTNTPGYAEEKKLSSKITRTMTEQSATMEAHEVASKILSSVEAGQFTCTFGVNGYILNVATCGASPIFSYWELIAHTILAVPAKIAIFITNRKFYNLLNNKSNHEN